MSAVGWVCRMERVRVVAGEKVILDGVSLDILQGARIGVVGPNGAGKSTTLAVIGGVQAPTDGRVEHAPEVDVGYLPQDPALDEAATVADVVDSGVSATRGLLTRYAAVGAELADDVDPDVEDVLIRQLGELQEEIDRIDGWDVDARVAQAMHALRCPPPDARIRDLSGGERRRVALCRLLLAQPGLLLLDEPTNHLDADSVSWLQEHLRTYPGTVVAVTHDRYLLEDVAQWILELDRGRAHVYEGNYATYLEMKSDRLAVEGRKDEKRQKQLRAELEWLRSAGAGRARSTAARLARYEERAAEAEGRRQVDFDEIQIPPGPRLGTQIIDVTDLVKGFDGRQLIRGLSFSLPRGGIVGVLGPNGVGKTTLFEMLAGREKPDAGRIEVGATVRLSYVDQARAGLDPDATAWEAVSSGADVIRIGSVDIPARAYVAAFGFKGATQQKPVRLFSGGERGRLNLALTLRQGGNVLLLDEPANDLDTETLASFERALEAFPGCAVITAHDRWFLERVASHILAWEGTDDEPARWHWHDGDYASYLAHRRERLGDDADRLVGGHRRLGRG